MAAQAGGTRHLYQGTAQDGSGRLIASASITVYLANTTTLATCYDQVSGGSAVSGSVVTSNAYGFFEFYIDDSEYTPTQKFKIIISKTGYTSQTWDYLKIIPDESYKYWVDANATDQGAATTRGDQSVKDLVDTISTDEATLVFAHSSSSATTTYTFSTNETIPANINVVIEKGVRLSIDNGVVLTLSGTLSVGPYQFITGSGSITVSGNVGEVYAEWWGAARDGTTDDSSAIQAAIDSIEAAGGGLKLKLLSGTYKCTSQLTIDEDSITIEGCGNSVGTPFNNTTLYLASGSNHRVVIGNGSTQRSFIKFCNMHIADYEGDAYYLFETRYVTRIIFQDITFGGAYGFAQMGRSGEATTYVFFDGINGNLQSPTHEHFINAVNVPGGITLAGQGKVEGANPIVDSAFFMHFGAGTVRPDGIQVGPGWEISKFDRFFNFRTGLANVIIHGPILDGFKTFGVYADSAAGVINALEIYNTHIISYDQSVVSHGIYVEKSTEIAQMVRIMGNKIYGAGANGIWITGAMVAEVCNNIVMDCGQKTDDTYASYRIGVGIDGTVQGNSSISTTANKVSYGFRFDTTEDDFIATGNVSTGHQTAAILDAGTSDADRIITNNTSQGFIEGSATFTTGSIADGDEAAQGVTVTGAALGDYVLASLSADIQDLQLDAQVTASDTVTCILSNSTGGAIDLGTPTVYVRVIQR